MNARLLLLSLLALSPVAALADGVHVSVKNKVALGEGMPALQVHIEGLISGFVVTLKRSDGKTLDLKGGGRPGVTRSLPLEQPEGRFHYDGELIVNFPDAQPASMPLSFDTEVLGDLKLSVAKEDVDVGARKLRFTLSRPAARAHVKVLMDTGREAFDDEVPFHGEPEGQPLEVTWPEAEGRVLRISLKAYDTSDFYTGVDLFPWQVDIPHEEVNFASGRSEVPSAERAKLDGSFKLIADAVAKYGRFASLRLYVLGHTDTVGGTDANRELSLRRARAIAAYFRQRGLKLPVFYEGFGEQAPRVATPDETDEAGNRRAEYIIAVDAPALPQAPFSPQWRKL